ncbi:hypothetical protein GCM10009626_31950 [Brachybacterium sacelli]
MKVEATSPCGTPSISAATRTTPWGKWEKASRKVESVSMLCTIGPWRRAMPGCFSMWDPLAERRTSPWRGGGEREATSVLGTAKSRADTDSRQLGSSPVRSWRGRVVPQPVPAPDVNGVALR